MTNLNTLSLLAAGTCALTVASAANAGMVYWNMATASATSNNISNLTVGDLTQGNNNGTTTMISTTSPSSGYTFDLNGSSTSASGTSNAGAAARTGALATGANGSAYFQFTLTAGAGYTGSLTALGFGTRATGTGPASFTLRSSADNYASDLATASATANSTWTYKTMTLATSANLDESATVTFRLYGYAGVGSATAGTANWRIDDLTVTATTTATPAPGAVALLGVAGLVGARRRR
jgi:MYXO-CTERM domain-containing protein